MDELRDTEPFDRPAAPKRTPRLQCHCSCPKQRKEFMEQRRHLREAHRTASAAYLRGDPDVQFPPGTIAPPRLVPLGA